MNNYIDEYTIKEYLEEVKALEVGIGALEDRIEQIDSILRNEHNFAIGQDYLIVGRDE